MRRNHAQHRRSSCLRKIGFRENQRRISRAIVQTQPHLRVFMRRTRRQDQSSDAEKPGGVAARDRATDAAVKFEQGAKTGGEGVCYHRRRPAIDDGVRGFRG